MALTRKHLEELGIEKEIAEKIFEEHGKSIQAEQAKFADYDELKTNYENLGKEVEKLKKLDPEKMQEQINTLTETHRTEIANLKTAQAEALKKVAVKGMLGSAQDIDIALSQIDLSKVKVDENGTITEGFEDQFKSLKENKPFLFKTEEKFEGFKSKEGEGGEGKVSDPFVEAAKHGAGLI